MNRWPVASVASGLGALLVAVHILPPGVQALVLASVVLIGPGAALRSWCAFPRSIATLITLTAGLTLITIYSAIASVWAVLQPELSLAALGAVLIIAGSVRVLAMRRSQPARASASSGAHS